MSESPMLDPEDLDDTPEHAHITPRIIDTANHGRTTWRRGCRCNICREDHKLDLRERRAKKKQSKTDQAASADRKRKIYPTQVAVAAQLDALNAATTNPGLAAVALRMAAILDDPAATPQQPAAAGKLIEVFKELGLRPKEPSGKLAAVRDMVNRPISEIRAG